MKKYKHNFITDDEYFLYCYFNQLKEAGFVVSCDYEPFSVELTEGLINPYIKKTVLKTKIKEEEIEQVILKGSVYTPDFQVIWNPKGLNLFYQLLRTGNKIIAPFIANNEGNTDYSLIESKPDFDSNNMTRGFVNNQKLIWDKYEIYVNLIKNSVLFKETFAPREYFYTPTGRKKKTDFIDFDDFIK